MMSARSFSDILRMEAAMDLALITDLAERPPCAATEPVCLCLLLLIKCCLTSWTSKSISLARPWRGRRKKKKEENDEMDIKKQGDNSAYQMNKWNWSSMCQRDLVHYGGILSLKHSDSLRFRLKLPCRTADLRVCCSVDWKRRERSFDTKRIPKVAKISTDRIIVSARETHGVMKIHSFIYLLSRKSNWAA